MEDEKSKKKRVCDGEEAKRERNGKRKQKYNSNGENSQSVTEIESE